MGVSMRDRKTTGTGSNTIGTVVVAFWVGVTVGAAWVKYGFEPQMFLYAVAIAVGLAAFSLVMVWLWGVIFVYPVRSLDEPGEADRAAHHRT
jgi:hypothetical protein